MINTLISNGVTINGKHSYDDYGLILTSKTISAPEAQIKKVDVPGRNGQIDFSEVLTGDVRYNNRTISMTFHTNKKPLEWADFISELRNEIQEIKTRIIFDDDLAFYWYGRVNIEFSNSGNQGTVNMTADVDPYKYNITTSEDNWLWDPFDFETGVINNYKDIEVTGTYSVDLECSGKVQTPIIIVSAQMTATLDNTTTVTLNPGQNVVYDFVLDKGNHTMEFVGTGTVSIIYRGGSL